MKYGLGYSLDGGMLWPVTGTDATETDVLKTRIDRSKSNGADAIAEVMSVQRSSLATAKLV